MNSVDIRLPFKRPRGGVMPRAFPVKDQDFSASVRIAGIRRLPILSFLPYFSNWSRPRVKFTMAFDDPTNIYVIKRAEIMGPSGREWEEENVKLGHQYDVTLAIITIPSVHDYRLAIDITEEEEARYVRPWRREGRILNTGSVQSGENWFMWLLCFIAGMGVTVIGWVLFS